MYYERSSAVSNTDSAKGKKIRVLLTRSLLDGHDRGVLTVAAGLRDGGMEVIYAPYRVPEEIVEVALQEDIDVVGVSFSGGGHNYILSSIIRMFEEKSNKHIMVIAGGIIPYDDIPELEKIGVSRIFGPGTFLSEIVDYINAHQE